VIQPAELFGNLSDPMGMDGDLFDHGCLRCLGLDGSKCRCPIVADDGGQGRCHLVTEYR
jgi:hypothetical protein